MDFQKIVDDDYYLAASLGGLTIGTSPLEMTAAYGALVNDGYYREPTCIVKITDAAGKILVDDTIDEEQVYQTGASRMVTEALTGVIKTVQPKALNFQIQSVQARPELPIIEETGGL